MAKYEQKTKETDASVVEFIESVDSPKKREDAYKLLQIFEETSGFEAKMWGPSIIGFGSYHYKYETGHEGDAPLVGFSSKSKNKSLFCNGRYGKGKFIREVWKTYYGKSLYIYKQVSGCRHRGIKIFNHTIY